MKKLILLIFLSVTFFISCTNDSGWDNEFVKESWGKWIQDNHNPIKSITSEDYSDLSFLDSVLQGKTLVQLGESAHGVKEFNLMKVRLIKYLHQNMGFNVLAFESPIFTCYQASKNIESYATATDFMKSSIYGVWHTEEVLELFKYIKETQSTNNPLILTGFDIQPSYSRPQFLKDFLTHADKNYAEEVYQTASEFLQYRKDHSTSEFCKFAKDNMDKYINFYKGVHSFIESNKAALINDEYSQQDVDFIAQIMKNAYRYVTVMALDGTPSFEARDEGMADNLTALKNNLYKDRKIIVWAHNGHIRHNQQLVTGYDDSPRLMGYWISRNFKNEIYTVLLNMFQGKVGHPNANPWDVIAHPVNSMEQIINSTGEEFVFVDIQNQKKESGNSWMFETIQATANGNIPIKYTPSDQCSGIILIKNVNPPDYLPKSSRVSELRRIEK